MPTHESLFEIPPTMEGEDRFALEAIERLIKTEPQFAQQTLDLYYEDPESVEKMLDFLGRHPEGMGVLEAWSRVHRERLDMEVELPAEVEEHIQKDGYLSSVRKDFAKSPSEELRNKMRLRRWKLIIKGAA